MPVKKAPASPGGRRKNSVATLLAFVTETCKSMFLAAFLSVCDRQPDLDDLAVLLGGCLLYIRVSLARDERRCHQGHDGQPDNFVEVSYK